MSTHRRSPQSGFTLVELLVVIGIIAVLITILLPVLNKARSQAKLINCASNERQVLMAFTMYVSDNKNMTPVFPAINFLYPGPNAGTGPQRSMGYYMDGIDGGFSRIRYDVGAFWKYLSLSKTPNAQISQGQSATSPPNQTLFEAFNCPEDVQFRPVRFGSFSTQPGLDRNFSYSWNVGLYNLTPPNNGGWADARGSATWNNVPCFVSRITQIVSPSQKIILEEEAFPNDGWSYAGYPNDDPDDVPSHIHIGGRCNMGFADGHVESFSLPELGYSVSLHPEDPPVIVNRVIAAKYFRLTSNAQN